MSAPVRIVSGGGHNVFAKVTDYGQLVVAPLAYDTVEFNELDATATAFTFFTPEAGKAVVLTGIRLRADRSVSTSVDATVIVYESATARGTVVGKSLFQENMVRGESASLFPLNVLTTQGVWINATTTDATIFITLTGYYVDAV